MKRLAVLGLLCAVVGAALCPVAAAAADSSECTAIETAVRSSYDGTNITPEQANAWAVEAAASCWAEVRAVEAAEAKTDAEIRRSEERQTRREERQAAEKKEREREQRQAEARRQARQEREAHEWAVKPTVTQLQARYVSRRLLSRSAYNVWTVDCGGGRIDRTHWSCGAKVYTRYTSYCTRIRVAGAGYKNHRPWFHSQAGEFRPC